MYNGKKWKEGCLRGTDKKWTADHGCALAGRADFLERSEDKSWKDSSIHILLNGLLSKNAIREAGFVRRSKTYGRTFLPTMTREEYYAMTIFSHRYQPDMEKLVQALLYRDDVTVELLEKLELQIQKRKDELK